MNEFWLSALNAAVAFVIAVLSGLGVGSGGLLVIWLTLIGVNALQARGMNLLFFVFSASTALIFHIRNKRRVKLSLVLYLAIFALVGTLIGAALGSRIDSSLLRRIFGGLLALSGAYTLLGRWKRADLGS
jgi:uncharacterized membrane protein YfcA